MSIHKLIYLGTYSLFGQTQCTACPSGFYADKPGSADCVRCPIGHQCSNPRIPPVPCAPGTATAVYGQIACLPCVAGEYTEKNGSSRCNPCPVGHQCNDSSIAPIKCPIGTFSGTKQSTCTTCPLGYYNLEVGAGFCLICGPGKFFIKSLIDFGNE